MGAAGFAARVSSQIEDRGVPTPRHPVRLPSAEDDPHGPSDDGQSLGYAEGQSFIIEYVSASGHESTRRITVFDIKLSSDGVPALHARCHERKANRLFRLDRIACCIDFSGEVFEDVPAFVSETFGMDLAIASARPNPEKAKHWQGIVSSIRPEALLLVAVALADHELCDAEVADMVDILALKAERRTGLVSEDDVRALSRYLHRLRPTEPSINRAIEELSRRSPHEIREILLQAVSVMDADGIRRTEERHLINDLAVDLLGLPLFE